jgi:hypothetical protein
MRGGALLALLALTSACGRVPEEEAVQQAAPAVAPAPSASTTHGPDQLAPGELVEGGEKAFGIVLPRDLRVEETFADVVYASGPVGIHALVQYFSARVTEGGVREGPDAATFEHVHARGGASPPNHPTDHVDRDLTLRILRQGGGVRVELRDTTPPVIPVLPDEAQRWKQVGLTPEGRIADPTHLD